MDLETYERELSTMRGEGDTWTDQQMLVCCALGLAGEVTELVEASASIPSVGSPASVADFRRRHVLLEAGDVLWYVITAAARLGYPPSKLRGGHPGLADWPTFVEILSELQKVAGRFADTIKKAAYHGRRLDDVRESLGALLSQALALVDLVARANGRTLADVAAANVSKLRERFPSGGFNAREACAKADENIPGGQGSAG